VLKMLLNFTCYVLEPSALDFINVLYSKNIMNTTLKM